MLGAVLTQSTSWRNVESAIAQLRRAKALSAKALRDMPEEHLAGLIHSSGYYNAKAKKLKALCGWLAGYDDNIEIAFAGELPPKRRELLGIYGIGPETADSILLYAAGKHAFVIDAYTRRICQRLGLCEQNASYESCQRLFTEHMDADVLLFNEYHALLVRLGKDFCRPNNPLCPQCCLGSLCSYAGREPTSVD
ncbi:MAG: endonuclease [Dehalococcoidia bacterium]|nr:endonuclease [Dehalococcoidia bacterium]